MIYVWLENRTSYKFLKFTQAILNLVKLCVLPQKVTNSVALPLLEIMESDITMGPGARPGEGGLKQFARRPELTCLGGRNQRSNFGASPIYTLQSANRP